MTLSVSERSAYETKTQGVGDMFKALFKNDQAMTVVLSIICVYTSLNICGNLLLYFFQFDVKNAGAYSIFTAAAFLGQVIMMMVIPLLRRRFSKNSLYLFGFVLQIAGFVTILIMAYTGV